MYDLKQLRREKDDFFQTSNHSPLTREQQAGFQGLQYFPENSELNLELELEVFPEQARVQIQTTTGQVQSYDRYGRIRFQVNGQEAVLTVYSNEHGLFLPFADSLAGSETYGAGRYLEPAPLPGGLVHVDFNLAYNPYCAYNEAWSCPITPAENRLKVPIRAGEKNFE